ncbi:FKBP-type peptidyl-prolyl cis-trans isomerase [Sphingomonas immobilis]|uniref:Peptidyl-prolyl cis-trans isomerase n=1 Tax=Sphingomonas immobilis TaxID=3063997 RepID=A0ABT9A2L9_9SPHN|nr:FKBP-type peptidyl-prolyl cis-trans isomerase [Sphingomonas sp. CA1-15]MDO7844060.1 FKBP-type peptidyl-prolyl cis-trans isomerase [Sphingomonas sp. CA1-15]
MSSITAVPMKPIRRSVLAYLWVAIVLALVGATALAMQAPEDFLVRNARAPGVVTTASGLQYKELSPGDGGTKPTDTDVALVNYEGKLLDGTVFDKSQQPTPMPIRGVVPGFGEALKLMTRGSKYQFWLKPELAYGDKANGAIPAKSVLVFTVDLIDFKSEAWLRQAQMQQQMLQQGGALPPGALPPGAVPPGAEPARP